MPSKSAEVKNEKQYEAVKDKGMPKERAAKIASSPGSSKRGGQQSRKGEDSLADMTTTPNEPLTDPEVVPSGDPAPIEPEPEPETAPQP